MNTATVRRNAPKRPPLSNSPAGASLPHAAGASLREPEKKIFFSDDLRHRWEQIVSKGCS